MTKKSRPTLLFDLDGTLAETAPDLCNAMNHVLENRGLAPVPTQTVRGMIGGGAKMILQRGLASHGVTLPEAELDKEVEVFVAWYKENIDTHSYVYEGIQSILTAAHQADIALGVVTNKRFDLSDRLLTRLGLRDYFPVLLAGDSLPTRKPDPATIYEAMRQLDSDPSQTLMIGDSEADTMAAQSAGIGCICVTFGYALTPVETLGADALIDDYTGFIDTVGKLRPLMGYALENIQTH